MSKRQPTMPNPSPQPNSTSARVEAIVDKVFARLTQLHPTQEADQGENGQPGELARHVIDRFREGVAKTAKELDQKP